MKQITIPVHPLSRKVLIKDFGQEPIKLTWHNEEVKMMILPLKLTAPKFDLLTSSIKISVQKGVAKRIRESKCYGYHLYHHHMNQILHFMWARHPEIPVHRSMKKYCQIYNLMDEDIKQETIYKRWQRSIYAKNAKSFPKINEKSVLRNKEAKVKRISTKYHLSENLGLPVSMLFSHIYNGGKKMDYKWLKKVIINLMRDYMGFQPSQIAVILSMDISTIYHHLKDFGDVLQIDDKLKSTYNHIIADAIRI